MKEEPKMINKEKKNNSKTIITVLVAIIALLLVVIAVLLWMLLGKSENNIVGKVDSVSESSGPITIGNPDDEREAIEIETKYCALYYPLEWEKNLRTEIVEKDDYKVEFYGTVEGKEEQHLFDLIFNGEVGYNLGTIKIESGEDVSINIESYSFETDNTWTEDEEFILYAMQEDINYTIGMLAENENFTISE
jgi:hypothetical protein